MGCGASTAKVSDAAGSGPNLNGKYIITSALCPAGAWVLLHWQPQGAGCFNLEQDYHDREVLEPNKETPGRWRWITASASPSLLPLVCTNSSLSLSILAWSLTGSAPSG